MHAIRHNSIVTQCLSVGQLFNGQLAELPAILDSLFSGLVNTTSTSIGVEGGGAATKWRVPPILKLNRAKWCQLKLFWAPHTCHKM